jgi:antitoxin HicB
MSKKNNQVHGTVASIEYYAKINRQRDGTYLVEFPELEGCLTYGDSLDDAMKNAKEALSGWLYVGIKAGDEIPEAVVHSGKNYHAIIPDLDVAVPLAILRARKGKGLTQNEMAKRLGVTQQSYRKFEIPGKSNPTLKNLLRLSKLLEFRIAI